MKKKFLVSAYAVCLLLSLAVLSFLFHSPDDATATVSLAQNSFEQKTGTFTYSNNYTDTYFYSDGYFFGDPTEYNPQLSTMSFCLALSSFSTEENGSDTDFSNNSSNIRHLLCEELGYTDFSENEHYSKEPSTDSIAVAAAHKRIRDAAGNPCTLIAVAVRGGGYGKEWTSNFTLGESGQAKGFCNAKEQVLEFLKDYISSDNHISGNVKFWICGFSRGAATSNLVAAAINDTPNIFGSGVKFSTNDIYAYCFATPMGALREDILSNDASKYSNIWNVINKNDPVPYVAMKELGFDRYGNDHYFPDTLTVPENYHAMQEQMEEHYRKLPTFSEIGEYSIDEFKLKKIDMLYLALAALDLKDAEKHADKVIADDWRNNWTQGLFLDNAISTVTKESVRTRSNYVAEYEAGIRTILDTVFGSVFAEYPAKTTKICFDVFVDKLKNPLNIAKIVYGIFESDNSPTKVITSLLMESMNECGMSISSDKLPELEKFAKAAISLVTKFAINHPNLTATLFSNIKHIASGHNNELYFAWLKAEDKNYTPNPVFFCGTGSYRTITISDSFSVEVLNSENETVAFVSDNTDDSIPASSLCTSIDESYNRMVILPITADYTIKITADTDSSLCASVAEFSHVSCKISRTVDFSDVGVKKGDSLTLHIPAYSDTDARSGTPSGSNTKYELHKGNENIPATSDAHENI